MFAKLRGRVRIAALGLALVACNADRLAAPTPASEIVPPARAALVSGASVVISQVYGAGGNSGATYNADFVELFNRGDAPQDISGWKIHYGSSTGTSWTNSYVIPANKVIQPGRYFLVSMAKGANGDTLPTADAVGGIAMGAGNGKVVLTSANVSLSGACPSDPKIVDRVGFGAATGSNSCDVEWGRTSVNTSTLNAAFRKDAGCALTNGIVGGITSDWEVKAVSPRNGGSAMNGCGTTEPPATPVVTTVTVTPATLSVALGSPISFAAAAQDQEGKPVAATFTWASSDSTVAIPAANGAVTAYTPGTAVISATSANGIVGSANLTVTAPLPPVEVPSIVISQVYGGGGNSGATLKNDFVELLNPGSKPVDVTGWTIQYASAALDNPTWKFTVLSGVIQPGQYFLVQEGAGAAANAVPLPSPDAADTISMGGGSGKIVLARQATALTGNCPTENVVDRVGYGATNCSGATPSGWGVTDAPAPSNALAILRKASGCTYTNVPGADFATGTPNPRNSSGTRNLCVQAGPLDHAVIYTAGSTVPEGGLLQLVGAGEDADNLPVSGATITWSSSSPANATVDNTGKVTGVLTSTTPVTLTLTVVAGGITKTTARALTVTPPPEVATVTVSPASATAKVNETRSFTAVPKDDQGNTLSRPITWSVADAAIASVDPTTGVVTAHAPGVTTVTAATPNGVQGTATVTVAGSIGVQGRAAALPVGFQTQLFLNSGGTDAFGAPVFNSDLTWTSSNPDVVRANPTGGVITATGVGSATLTATLARDGVTKATTTIVTAIGEVAPGARTGFNTALGIPADGNEADDILIARRQYTTSYNPARGVANWVSWNLDASHKGSAARCNCMTADTALVRLGFPAYETSEWVNNGTNGQWSRGHMSPSADWQASVGDNAATFFLTNMLPQNQEMNGGPWGAFEDYLRTRATGSAEIYIVSGGIWTKDRSGAGRDGFGTINNAGRIAIPDSIWKIAVIVPDTRDVSQVASPAEVEVIAINTPNEAPVGAATWQSYQTTIAKIEASTKYDFLSAITEQVQCRLEARNCAPVARITGTGLAGGDEGQVLTFEASTSTDFEGSPLSFEWSVNGTPAGTGPSLSRTFADNGSYEVRLVARDPQGAVHAATATVSIANVAPSVNALAGATIDEGGTFTTSGAFVDPGDDTWTATVDYGDGSGPQPLALGADKRFTLSHQYGDDASHVVTVTVTEADPEGLGGTATATVTVVNVAPVVATFAGATLLAGETYASSGSFADAPFDRWTATVNYGDGSGTDALPLDGTAFTLSHRYLAAGTFTTTVAVQDDDGGIGTRTGTVVVQSPVEGVGVLGTMTAGLGLKAGEANSLRAKLNAASAQLERGNVTAAVQVLQAFAHEVDALVRSSRITAAQGAVLNDYVQRVIRSASL